MPVVPRQDREQYRQWAKDNAKLQMDTRAWVPESDWQDWMRKEEPEKTWVQVLKQHPGEHIDSSDGLTVHGGSADCVHEFVEWEGGDEDLDGEPPMDVCIQCGGVKY